MLRLLFTTTTLLLFASAYCQSSTLFVYSADSTLFNFSLNNGDTTNKSASAFEIINIETEIQGITVFINKKPSFKKLLFLRLGDSTVVKVGSSQLSYGSLPPTSNAFYRIDAQKLGKKLINTLKDPVVLVELDEKTEQSTQVEGDLLRYSYMANDSLNASDFILPDNQNSPTEKICNYTLSEKDLKRLKSKMRIFPDAYDQKRMLEEDLEFTCFTTDQLSSILKNMNDDEAKFLLLRNIWQQCSDPKNLKELGSLFLMEIYQKDYIDFLENRLYE